MRHVVAFRYLNPEPWSAMELSTKRLASGKVVPTATKKAVQRAYQDAIASFKSRIQIEPFPKGTPVWVRFYFSRQLERQQLAGGGTRRRLWADATNMQKSLEDALQGILYENDNQVRSVQSIIVEQHEDTDPLIVVEVGEWSASDTGAARQRIGALLAFAPDDFDCYWKENV